MYFPYVLQCVALYCSVLRYAIQRVAVRCRNFYGHKRPMCT